MTNRARPWHQSLTVLLLSAVAIPPLGLVLLWIRRGTKVIWKLLGTIPILGFAVAHLFLFFGLRVEMDGSVTKPMFSFGTGASHYEQLEASRAAQSAGPGSAPGRDSRAGAGIRTRRAAVLDRFSRPQSRRPL